MRLVELEPRWIHPNIFAFWCPHCRKVLLTCKNVEMSVFAQFDIWKEAFGEEALASHLVVPCRDGMAWSISGTSFENMTVNPSLDASASGHWHGNIKNGNIS